MIVILSGMAVIIFINVALRYLTNHSIEWAEEVARHLMIWLTFLGSGLVLRFGGHIAVENVQEGSPRRVAIAMRVLVAFLLALFFFVIVWYGVLYAIRTHYQITPATQVPFSYVYAAMPIGGVLLLVHLAFIVRMYVRDRTFVESGHCDANASASL